VTCCEWQGQFLVLLVVLELSASISIRVVCCAFEIAETVMVLVLSLVSFHNLLLLDGVCTPLEEQKPVSTKICSLLIGIRNSVQFRKISNPGMSYAWSIILSLLQKYTALLFSKNQLNILVLRCRTYQISNKHGAVSNYTGQQRFCSMRKNVYF